MLEEAKEEIMKWLKANLIYAILDGSWVSPVLVVPKKSNKTIKEE